MNRRLHLLHITAPAPVGGLESVLLALAPGLAQRGHDVHVAAVLDRGAKEPLFLAKLEGAGVGVRRIVLPPRAYLRERREIRALCRSLSPDVVHTHSDRPDVIDAPVARRLKIPTVSTLHGSCKMGGKARLYEWLQARSLRHFNRVIAVSRPLTDEAVAQGVPPDRVLLIPNAWSSRRPQLDRIEARKALSLPTDVPVIAWVGRLIPVKAADVFVEALSNLRSSRWQAVILGDGPAKNATESLARARGLSDRVSFLGTVADAASYYAAFDVFVLSSHSEGTPITIFEAMAARVPIVATRVGGVPDMLGDTGTPLVEPGQPIELAGAIDGLLSEPQRSIDLAARAAERLEKHYGLDPWLDAHERAYRDMLAELPAARTTARQAAIT